MQGGTQGGGHPSQAGNERGGLIESLAGYSGGVDTSHFPSITTGYEPNATSALVPPVGMSAEDQLNWYLSRLPAANVAAAPVFPSAEFAAHNVPASSEFHTAIQTPVNVPGFRMPAAPESFSPMGPTLAEAFGVQMPAMSAPMF